MKRLLLLLVLVACSDLPSASLPADESTPGDLPQPVVELLELQLVFDYSCRVHGENPRHTFRADVDPDTLEITYELVSNDSIFAHDFVGAFTDTLFVDWGGPWQQRVEFVLTYQGWRVEGVTRCRVQ